MTSEVQGKLQKFLYHLSNEDYSNADKEIKSVIEHKVKTIFNKEYDKLKKK